jgi:hypothetical protein
MGGLREWCIFMICGRCSCFEGLKLAGVKGPRRGRRRRGYPIGFGERAGLAAFGRGRVLDRPYWENADGDSGD